MSSKSLQKPDGYQSTLSEMRAQLRALSHAPTPFAVPVDASILTSGIDALDRLLPGGGIPLGRLTELSGGRSSGKRSIALAFGTQALANRRRVAWLDGRGGFYPLPAFEQGAPLDQLLVIRLPERPARDLLKATEMLLQASRALTLIVIDADLHRQRLSLNQLSRLRLGAERGGTALLFVSETDKPSTTSLGTFIALHLTVQRQGKRDAELTVVKSKLGQMAHRARITLDAPHSLHLDSTV
jgi:recombination protein RecA